MTEGLTRRQGPRARLEKDVERGLQQDHEFEESSDDESHQTKNPSRFSAIVSSCSAPVRERMIRRDHLCCRSTLETEKRQRSYCSTSSMLCLFSYCQLWPSTSFLALNNQRGSIQTIETDEETPDEDHPLAGSSVIVPSSPKMIDYSKCRAPLPDIDPLSSTLSMGYTQNLNDDDSSTNNHDTLQRSHRSNTNQRVQFALRVPKIKRQLRERKGPKSLSAAPNFSESVKPRLVPKRPPNRRRSNSSDTTDITPRNAFVAPFPIPMSRENSTESLQKFLIVPDNALLHTPIQRKRINQQPQVSSPAETSDSGSYHLGELMEIPLKEEATTPDNDGGTPIRHAYSSDEELAEKKSRRTVRMQRRSSFVAGSKIERFDGNDANGRSRARRGRNQRRGTASSTESYTEWKIDLMVNG
jgi:hypothetical protein